MAPYPAGLSFDGDGRGTRPVKSRRPPTFYLQGRGLPLYAQGARGWFLDPDWSRIPVLDRKEREIATLPALASMAGVDSQLEAHIRIATNVGLTATRLEDIAAVLGEAVGDKQGRRDEAALRAVLPEQGEAPAESA